MFKTSKNSACTINIKTGIIIVIQVISIVNLSNHPVERFWVEMNTHVVKACLVKIEEQGEIGMECSLPKFCVSWFAIRVCCVGTKL